MAAPSSDSAPDSAIHRPLSSPARPELTGGHRIGVLVSHGFTGSPASMRPWADDLLSRGYAVEMPLLPGHGTRWQDLNATGWSEWYAEVSRAFETLASSCDQVFLAGLSMGGALMLQLAEDRGDAVSGVIVVNPAIATQRKDVLALPVLKHLVGSFPGISNDIAKPDTTEYAYTRTPLKAAHSMMQAWKPLRARLGEITAPVLFFKSDTDHVVDPSTLAAVRAGVRADLLHVRALHRSFHVATLDHDAPAIFDESAAFIDQHVRA